MIMRNNRLWQWETINGRWWETMDGDIEIQWQWETMDNKEKQWTIMRNNGWWQWKPMDADNEKQWPITMRKNE